MRFNFKIQFMFYWRNEHLLPIYHSDLRLYLLAIIGYDFFFILVNNIDFFEDKTIVCR